VYATDVIVARKITREGMQIEGYNHDGGGRTAAMSAFTNTLASYVPGLIIHRLVAAPTPISSSISEHFPAAVLFADISGFTALTEYLAQQGPAGAEVLTRELNTYFGRLIDIITLHSGDVIKFAGDALTAVWPVTKRSDPDSLPVATQHAAACALAIQAALQDYQTRDGHRLAVRMGLGAGTITAMHLGGIYGRWEFVINGPPLSQVSQAQAHAQPSQVIASPEAWALLQRGCTGRPLADGYVRVEAMEAKLDQPAGQSPVLPAEVEAALRAYIPGAILARLAAGQSGWLAELRRVTVLFINLPDLTDSTPLDQAQVVMQALQTALYRYEGSLNRIGVDDKGPMLLAALGLPPLAHEDDAVRGVQAALAMQAAVHDLGWRCAIGVTTGRAFCGSVGNSTRREYTMMGDMVNLAARLTQAAAATKNQEPRIKNQESSDDSEFSVLGSSFILCDEATYQAAHSQIAFEALPAINVKGKTQPIPIYRPSAASAAPARGPKPQPDMVGRAAEQMLLADALQQLRRGRSGVVIIEGEAGIGKSRLVAEALAQAQAIDVLCLVGAGDPIEKNSAYHAWQPIFRDLLGLAEGLDSQAAYQELQARLTALSPGLAEQAPLLSAVLPFEFPDNQLTREWQGQPRAERTRALLAQILAKMHAAAPLLLVLEDAHWLDSASWALLAEVRRVVQPLLLLLAARPPSTVQAATTTGSLPTGYQQLLADPGTQTVQLAALPAEDMLSLVCQRLGVTVLPEVVADFIQEKAEGHPFFSEELALALRDAGLIELIDGQCRLAAGVTDLHSLAFPETLQGVITSRIDRLTASQQLALKVASVIGRAFAFRVLREVHPIEADKPALPMHFAALERLDLTLLESPEPELTYIFKHIITQEVAYNLMAFSQRRQLHQGVAEWYERVYSGELAPFFPILAHHWRMVAQDQRADPAIIAKAIEYLHKAGEQAVHRSANVEAISHFSMALELLATLPEVPERDRQELKLQLAASHPLMAAKGYSAPETIQTVNRACRLAEQLGDTAYIFPLLFGQWVNHHVRSDRQVAQDIGIRFLRLAKQQADTGHIVLGHRLMGYNLIAMGEFKPAYAHLEHAMTRYDPQQHRSMAFRYGQDTGATAQVLLALALGYLGYPDQALQNSHQAVATAHELNHANTLGYVVAHACLVDQLRGDIDSVAASVQTLVDLCQQHRLPLWLGIAASMEGWVMLERGQAPAGVARIREGLAGLAATGSKLFLPHLSGWLAQGYAALGQMTEALNAVDEALKFVHETDERWWEAEIYRIKGELLTKDVARTPDMAQADASEACFLKAIEVARRQEAKAWELRATVSLARLWRAQGKHEQARQILAEIYGWFAEGFETADLQAAKALLEESEAL
jgi:predicted ATPase/class 3 adenylate cyclase